jgi:hypothetical protein
MIESVLNFASISLSIDNIKESVKNSSLILLQSLVLTIFMVTNAQFCIVVLENGSNKNHD